jgi:NAD(P)-dependent dehydrogenase (short-subunit alcohol dehydrogenase family)
MLKDKVIVVSGGSGLIGREFISAIIKQNGIAVIADIDEAKGKLFSMKISKELDTDRIEYVNFDITQKKSIVECIEYLDAKYKQIDALVNCAYPKNKNYGRHFFEIELDDFIQNIGINLGGCIIPSQLFAKYFKNQGYGNIINIASIYGVIAPKFDVYNNTKMTMPLEYAAIKSSLIHLTKYMAKYFHGMNIRVNAISPGGILESQEDEFLKNYNNYCLSKGMLDTEDLNGALIYLLSDGSKFVNGQNLVVDDGFTL